MMGIFRDILISTGEWNTEPWLAADGPPWAQVSWDIMRIISENFIRMSLSVWQNIRVPFRDRKALAWR